MRSPPPRRFGERFFAIADLKSGADAPGLAELATHVRAHLTDCKALRELVLAPANRAPNGKVDHRAAKTLALGAFGMPA